MPLGPPGKTPSLPVLASRGSRCSLAHICITGISPPTLTASCLFLLHVPLIRTLVDLGPTYIIQDDPT